jgi:hypothetical protein
MKYLYLLFLILLFISCQQTTEVIELPALRASSILEPDSVRAYILKYKDDNKEIAGSYLKRGKDIQEKDPKKSIYFYRRAITLYPNGEYYKTLGVMLMKNNMYKEANDVYSFICTPKYISSGRSEYLFAAPDKEIFYEYLIANMKYNGALNQYIVYQGNEMGFDIQSFKEKLLSDQRLQLDPKSIEYQNLLLTFMTQEEIEEYKTSQRVFNEFLTSIKDSSAIFEIDKKSVQKFNYSRFVDLMDGGEDFSVTDFYMYFLQEKQEFPNNWYAYNFNHRITISDSLKAVVYAIDTSATACPKDMRHIYHRLVTYKKNGKIIDSRIIAVQSGESLNTVSFNRDRFTIAEFKRVWKKPYSKTDFDNDIEATEMLRERSFHITSEGTIEEETIPAQPSNTIAVSDSAI